MKMKNNYPKALRPTQRQPSTPTSTHETKSRLNFYLSTHPLTTTIKQQTSNKQPLSDKLQTMATTQSFSKVLNFSIQNSFKNSL